MPEPWGGYYLVAQNGMKYPNERQFEAQIQEMLRNPPWGGVTFVPNNPYTDTPMDLPMESRNGVIQAVGTRQPPVARPSNAKLAPPPAPPRPGVPPTGPTGGLTTGQILEAYRRGGSYADAKAALMSLGVSEDEAALGLASITPMGPGTTPGGGATTGPGGGPVPVTGQGPPTVRPGPVSGPTRTVDARPLRGLPLSEQFGDKFAFRQFLERQMPGVGSTFRGFAERQRPFLETAMSLGQLAGQEHPSFESFLERTGGAQPSASQFQDLLRQGAGVFGAANPTAAQQTGLGFFQDPDLDAGGVSQGLNRQFQAALQSRQLGIAPMFRQSLGRLADRKFEDWLARTRGQDEFLPGFVNRGFTF